MLTSSERGEVNQCMVIQKKRVPVPRKDLEGQCFSCNKYEQCSLNEYIMHIDILLKSKSVCSNIRRYHRLFGCNSQQQALVMFGYFVTFLCYLKTLSMVFNSPNS